MKRYNPRTRLVHAGRNPEDQHGLVNPPVYHGSTVLFPTLDALERASADPFTGVYYGRHGTPTQFALQDAVTDLAAGAGAVTVGSGLAAIGVALLSVVEQGDHLLVSDNVYGPTRRLCDGWLTRMGVATTYFDPMAGPELAGLIRPETRAVFLESPGSLTFEVQDVPLLAEVGHAHGLSVIVDNTWATPLLFPALAYGADLCVQAGTKYIVGHADAMLGLVIAGDDRHLEALRHTRAVLGHSIGPDDCYLALRGLRTLDVRLRRHESNAMALAEWLAARPEVTRVLHPARADHPGHAVWARDFEGASGLFGIVLQPCGRAALAAMLDGLALFGMGYSWGGFESLILPVQPEKLRSATAWNTPGPCLRIHAGLEDVADLKADLAAGFERLKRQT